MTMQIYKEFLIKQSFLHLFLDTSHPVRRHFCLDGTLGPQLGPVAAEVAGIAFFIIFAPSLQGAGEGVLR